MLTFDLYRKLQPDLSGNPFLRLEKIRQKDWERKADKAAQIKNRTSIFLDSSFLILVSFLIFEIIKIFQMNDSLMVSQISEIERAEFYRKTYMHVAVAILAFGAVEYLLLKTVPLEMVLSMVSGKYIWLAVIGIFWLASMLATKLSFSVSRNTQYLGLGLYVLIEAVIFLPMLGIASMYAPEVITQAGLVTVFMFAGLTAAVFMTNKDFSFLRNIM